jgi:hypothetical protein
MNGRNENWTKSHLSGNDQKVRRSRPTIDPFIGPQSPLFVN